MSVVSSEPALTQYSFSELTSKIFGQVPLARQLREDAVGLAPVTGSVVTWSANGNCRSGYQRPMCWRIVRAGWAKR